MATDSIPDHKLCGFLRVVLTITSPHGADVSNTVPLNTPCHIYGEGPNVGFKSPDGVEFSLIDTNATALVAVGSGESAPGEGIGAKGKLKTTTATATPSSSRKRLSRLGLVHGNMSVVHQLHALVMHKCLRIAARVVLVVVGDDCGEVRVVVLVDVYLPIALWSGWQFPRSRPIAAALFRHLRCKEWCRLPVITPCRHLLCLDCVALNSERCTFPGCGNLYEMQSPETLARPENPNPKWPVPKDLIELQPSYKQDDWHPDWQSTSSSKVSYLVLRLKELQRANRTISYSLDEGDDAMNVDDLLLHVQKTEACDRSRNESSNVLLEKVIIFSQFLEHIHVVEQQLTVAGIKFTGLYSPMHSSNKIKSLAAFQHDAECMALLMDGSAALGLDLSFVTHVFLMEPIWDKSMEEQVISRAHRMGATRPIHVETLAMHGTIEEQMLKFLQNADECRRLLTEKSGKYDREGTRVHRTLHDFAESNYLAQLSFARTISRNEGPASPLVACTQLVTRLSPSLTSSNWWHDCSSLLFSQIFYLLWVGQIDQAGLI